MPAKKTTSATRKKVTPKPAAKKKSAAKKAAPKKVAAKKSAGKKVAPKKTAAKKKSAKRSAPKKATAKKVSKPVAAKKTVAKKAVKKAAKKAAPAKAKAERAPVEEKPAGKRAARKRKAPAKVAVNDPLAPRPKRRPKKLDVLRPGRKKARNHTVKSRSYRAPTAKQKEKYRIQLLELRDRISGQISSLKRESLTRADEVNIEEDGTDAFDRQFALNLASSENEALVAIDGALERIAEGSFGKCQECGGGIESARLKAIPFVENCISCQSEVEKHRPGYRPPIRLD